MPTFAGPTERMPFAKPLEMFTYPRGRTVYRSGGAWIEGSDFTTDELATADVVGLADRPGGEKIDGTDRYLFGGGRVYTISSAVASTLTAVDEVNGVEHDGYGSYVS